MPAGGRSLTAASKKQAKKPPVKVDKTGLVVNPLELKPKKKPPPKKAPPPRTPPFKGAAKPKPPPPKSKPVGVSAGFGRSLPPDLLSSAAVAKAGRERKREQAARARQKARKEAQQAALVRRKGGKPPPEPKHEAAGLVPHVPLVGAIGHRINVGVDKIPLNVGKDVKTVGYGLADMAGRYIEAGLSSNRGVEIPKQLVRDASGFIRAVDVATPEPPSLGLPRNPLHLEGKIPGFEKVQSTAEDRRQARELWGGHPLLAGLTVLPIASGITRGLSRGAIEGNIARANPKLPKSEVVRIAKKESKMPGYAAARGVKGGIPPRVLKAKFGEMLGRTQSRTPEGRAGQRAYDWMSRKVEERQPGARFSVSQRAAVMKARDLRRARQRAEAAITREEIIQKKGLKAKGLSTKAVNDAWGAVIEGPRDATPRQAIEMRIAELRQTAAEASDVNVIARHTKTIEGLQQALATNVIDSPKFAQAVESGVKLSEAGASIFREVTGASKESLEPRKNLILERYAKRGIIPSEEMPRTIEQARARLEQLDKAIKGPLAALVDLTYKENPEMFKMASQTTRAERGSTFKVPESEIVRRPHGGQVDITRSGNPRYVEPSGYVGPARSAKSLAEAAVLRQLRASSDPTAKSFVAAIDEAAQLRAAIAEREAPQWALGGEPGSLGSVTTLPAGMEARAFYPHRSIYEPIGKRKVGGGTLSAAGNVVGVPQKGRAFAGGPNELRYYEQGVVNYSPKVLANTLRGRLTYVQKAEARRYLYENGEKIQKGQRALPGAYIVRDPAFKPEKIPQEVKATVDDSTWLYRVEEGDAAIAPEWTHDLKHTRVVPERVVKSVLPDVFRSAPRGLLAPIMGTLNAAARFTTIYSPYFGLRYIARNAPQNMVLEAITHPGSFRYLGQATWGLRRSHPELYAAIKVEAGDVPARAGLPELQRPNQTAALRLEAASTDVSRTVAGWLGEAADEPFRVSAWIGYAKAYDFKTPAEWEALLKSKDPAMIRVRQDIAQRTRDDLIDFDALSPYERETLSRFLFIYPFVRGSLKWPAMYLREYPVRTAITSLLAAQHARETQGRRTSVLESGRTQIQGHEVDLGWLNPVQPAASTIENAMNTVRAVPEGPRAIAAQASRFLSPQYQAILGPDPSEFSTKNPWASVARSFIPGASTAQRIQKGGGPGKQALRFFGSAVDYKQYTRPGKVIEDLNQERKTVLPALHGKVDPKDEAFIRQAYNRYQRFAVIRAEAKGNHPEGGESYYREVLANEADYLASLGVIDDADHKWLVQLSKSGSYDEVRKRRDFLIQNLYAKVYGNPLRYARKLVGYQKP